MISEKDAYQFGLLPLLIWKEARGQTYEAKLAVGWSVKNRVEHPAWWGHDYPSVIMCPSQYSSFNHADPNYGKFPQPNDHILAECINAATEVFFDQVPDPTNGATHFFDKSIDNNPPVWMYKMVRTCIIGDFRFFKDMITPTSNIRKIL